MTIEYVNRSEYQSAQRRLKAIFRKEEQARHARKQARKNKREV